MTHTIKTLAVGTYELTVICYDGKTRVATYRGESSFLSSARELQLVGLTARFGEVK